MNDIRDLLATVPYFAELSDELLDELCEAAEIVQVSPGTEVIVEGGVGDAMYVVLEGDLEISKWSEGRQVVLNHVGPGEVQGEMALLEDSPRGATVTSTTEARLLRVPVAMFRDLIADPQFLLDLLKTVVRRLRDTEATLRHEGRMAALGKMAAQLMHELNNPAAAVGRSAHELSTLLDRLQQTSPVSASGTPPGSALRRSELEDELGEVLKRAGVDRPWELGAALVADGFVLDDLQDLDAGGLEAIGLRSLVGQLADEIGIAASRISELVRVVKTYSFVDQAPVQEVDVRSGIDDTLVLLRHKLNDVDVTVDYADDLGVIEAPGRDLNQVWTNLIDNAADAMPPGGELRIEAKRENGEVSVSVANTGEPIPEDVLARIFDPFFTTKEPGKGTGLGLHTVYSILARMGGSVDVTSDPDWTVFRVTLPTSGS